MNELKQIFMTYLKENPIKGLSGLSFTIGGFFLLIYFFHIEYFPTSISFDTIFLVVLLSCFVGIGFIVFVILALSYPVFLYQQCYKLQQFERILKYKYLKKNQGKKLEKKKLTFFQQINKCIKSVPKSEKVKRYNPQVQLLLFPISLFIILSVFIVYLVFSEEKYLSGVIGFLILSFSMIFICLLTFYKSYKVIFKNTSFFKLVQIPLFYTYTSKIMVSLFFTLFSFIIAWPIMENSFVLKESEFLKISYLIIFILGFIVINIIEKDFLKRVLINTSFLFGILIVTKTLHIIPFFALKSFGLGQNILTQVSIDNKGCKIINPDIKDKSCIEKDLKLVWKVGKYYVFDKKIGEDFNSYKRYEIPSSSILSIEKIKLEKREEKNE